MPDQIWTPGPNAAPLIYTVPGVAEVVPLACQAVFDGSGASGAFLPTLRFRSQAGHVIADATLQSTVAAGASAAVSWFPRVAPAAAAAPTGGGLPVCYAQGAGGVTTGPSTFRPTWTTFQTNDSSVFTLYGLDNTRIAASSAGMYLAVASFTLSSVTSITTVTQLEVKGDDQLGASINFVPIFPVDLQDPSAGDPQLLNSASGTAIGRASSSNTPWRFSVLVHLGQSVTFSNVILQLVRLSTAYVS